ncbi:MAG: hypothetical protein ACI8R9_001129 [Paraglaciecola sp.]|jgi:hypothetical protein
MKLLLPLKYYDDAGRVKPSGALLCCLLFMCRTYLVSVASLSYREDSSGLLALFYPHQGYFYAGLAFAVPAVLVVLLVSFREKLFNSRAVALFTLITPLLLMGLLLDLGFHMLLANQQRWQFSWIIAITLILDFLCLYFVSRDKHLTLMVKDWVKSS